MPTPALPAEQTTDEPQYPSRASVTPGTEQQYINETATADSKLPTWNASLNAVSTNVSANAGIAESNATESEQSATNAAASEAEALDRRNEAEVFKNSAEAAAAAAQAGAGLPAVGNDDDVLTLIDSTTNTVAFRPRGKSGLVPLLTVTASGDSVVDFTDLDTYGYENFELAISTTSSDAVDRALYLQTSTDNGVSFTPNGTNNYYATDVRSEYTPSSSATNLRQLSSNTSIAVLNIISTSETTGLIQISSALNASSFTNIRYRRGYYSQLGEMQNITGYGLRPSNEINNAIRLVTSAGTITGKITLYGVSNA